MGLFIDMKLFLWHKNRIRYGPFDPVGGGGVRWGHLLIMKLFLWYKIRVRYGLFDPVEWWRGGGWAGLKD